MSKEAANIDRAFEEIACPICGASDGRRIGRFEEHYQIVKCGTCGLTRAATRPASQSTEGHYAEDYIPSAIELERDFGSRRRAALEVVAQAIDSDFDDDGAILDIGSAGGELLQLLPDRWQKTALEPSQVGADGLRSRGYEVVEDFFPSPAFNGRSFDVVSMMDVIMIVPDPLAALKQANDLLGAAGRLYVEIPGNLYRMMLHVGPVPLLRSRRWTDLNAKVHLFFFDKRSLTKMLDMSGFEVERVIVLPPSAGTSRLAQLQQRIASWTERLPGIRSGRPGLAAKYVFVAKPKPT